MYQLANEVLAVTMQHAFKIKRINNNILVNVEQDIMEKIALKERLIVKATHAMEARVCGHQLVTCVYVNMADMEYLVCLVSDS